MALIEDYGLIGDLETAALVSREGAIDWLCVPRFDSGAVFAALLGEREHGHWTIQPQGEFRAAGRRYRGDTLVLETELETARGCRPAHRLHAAARRRAGRSCASSKAFADGWRCEMELVLRFDYGVIVPWVRTIDGHAHRDRRPGRGAPAHAGGARGTRPADRRDLHRGRGGPRAVRPRVVPVEQAATRAGSMPEEALDGDRRRSGRSGRRGARTTGSGTTPSVARCSRSRRSRTHRPEGSSRRRRRRCRSGSAASATGTTATAGSATRR